MTSFSKFKPFMVIQMFFIRNHSIMQSTFLTPILRRRSKLFRLDIMLNLATVCVYLNIPA